MWKCPNCSEEVEDSFDACWNCQTERVKHSPPGAAPSSRSDQRGLPRAPSGQASSRLANQLERRYRDAYRVARATVFFGGLAKVLAAILAIIAVLAGIALSQSSDELAVLTGLVGVVLGLLLYVNGVLVAALGQLLLTSVDAVINTSPFLSDSERASIMRVAVGEQSESDGPA